MNTELAQAGTAPKPRQGNWAQAAARRVLISRLRGLRWGSIVLRENGREDLRLGNGAPDQPSVTLAVNDPAAWTSVALGGDIGAGQSFALGQWETSSLRDLMRIFLRNAEVLDGIDSGWSTLAMPLYRHMHRRRDNTRNGSRENISAHYDLGNDFFASFLDEQLLYSSAVYPAGDATLEEAQVEKMERICRQLALQPGQRLLEIGSGWGGFALHAARRHGVEVHTITLSREQRDYAQARIEAAGLQDLVQVELLDYRDVAGQDVYDHVVSIEMIEAVGHRHMATYLSTIDRVLRPGGRAVIQGITFPDRHFDRYLRMTDFIRHFIFPGGSLISMQQVLNAAAGVTKLELFHVEEIGMHYARTLREWHERFRRNREGLPEKYRDAEFQRLWAFYLQSCEACFMERRTGAVQLGFVKSEVA